MIFFNIGCDNSLPHAKESNAIVFLSYFIKFYLHVNKHHIFLVENQGKRRLWSVGIDRGKFLENGGMSFVMCKKQGHRRPLEKAGSSGAKSWRQTYPKEEIFIK